MKKTPHKKPLKPTKGSVSSSMRRADRTPGSMLVHEASSVAPLFERIVEILENARAGVVRSINSAMVRAYWNIGRELVEYVQDGNQRAEYGRAQARQRPRRPT